MTLRDLTQPDAAGLRLGTTRGRVLATLQDRGEPLAVGDVAELIGLHPNTARFHLDALVQAGVVERSSEAREEPGRPRSLYRAIPGSARAGQRSYRLLAEILTSYVAAQIPRPAKAAQEAGRAWGQYLAERPAPFHRIDAPKATQQLVTTLEEIGFAPEAVKSGRKRQVLLHHCPFRETAEEHRDVVCSIHLGLMQGLLEELGAPLVAERLDAFVEPALCVAHLATRSEPARARRNRSRVEGAETA